MALMQLSLKCTLPCITVYVLSNDNYMSTDCCPNWLGGQHLVPQGNQPSIDHSKPFPSSALCTLSCRCRQPSTESPCHAQGHTKEKRGKCICRLLAAVVAALGAPHCGRPSRDAALSVVEALLRHQEVAEAEAADAVDVDFAAVFAAVLAPHAPALLAALRSVVLAATGSGSKVWLLACIHSLISSSHSAHHSPQNPC